MFLAATHFSFLYFILSEFIFITELYHIGITIARNVRKFLNKSVCRAHIHPT